MNTAALLAAGVRSVGLMLPAPGGRGLMRGHLHSAANKPLLVAI